MENLKKFIKGDFKNEEELVTKILENFEDGESYKELPIFSKEIEKDSNFYNTYSNKFPIFVVASIRVNGKYLVIKNKNRNGIEFVGGKAEEYNFRKAIIREVKEEIGVDISKEKIDAKALILNKFKTPNGNFWHFGVGFTIDIKRGVNFSPLPSEVKEIFLVDKENLKEISFANKVLLWF